MRQMRILISNDDGIHAPGIEVLADAVAGLGEIDIVAPAQEQSGASHSVTLNHPLRPLPVIRKGREFGLSVSGTPADCVKLAVHHLLPQPPDLIPSGINRGSNAGICVIYSGTISAAAEGAILGIPSIAFSLCSRDEPLHWESAGHAARKVVENVAESGLPGDTMLSVNIPNLPVDQLRGFAVAPMGKSQYIDEFEERIDPRGNKYYWLVGDVHRADSSRRSDLDVLDDGYVALTPIHFDLTDHESLERLNQWKLSL